MKKRILSCLMALALCLTLLPTAALAEEPEGTAQTSPAVEEAADPANGKAKQENQPAEQEEQQEDSATKQDEDVAAVQAMIDALPDAAELDGMDDADAMAVYEAFQTACEAYYDTLTEGQQAQLKNTEKLAALSDWFSQLETLATEDTHTHCVCGARHNSIGDHTAESQITFDKWLTSALGTDSSSYVLRVEDSSSPTDGVIVGGNSNVDGWLLPEGTYYLKGENNGNDVTIDRPIVIQKKVTICLNGMTLQGTAGNYPVFRIEGNGELTLTDCQKDTGKVIHNSNITGSGSGVHVKGSGKFYLYGGTITKNTADYGGGVLVTSGTTFNMYGGSITNNTATGSGGGVFVSGTNSKFTMTGGTIGGNSAENGGGVFVTNGGTFTMNGGTIGGTDANRYYNQAKGNGGGVHVGNKGTFIMNGDASISCNEAKGNGGGVYMDGEKSTFTMTGDASISCNEAKGNGGGVYMDGEKSTFTMTGGEISGNEAKGNGGGVYVDGTTFTVSGAAKVTGNKKNNANNNVYLPESKNITIGAAQTDLIGVTTANAPTEDGTTIATAGSGYTITDADKASFYSDNISYQVVHEGDKLVLKASTPTPPPPPPTPTEHKHFLCGKTHTAIGDHKTDTQIIFTKWTNENALPDTQGSYYLDKDVTLSTNWIPADGTVLCLNGHSIKAAGNITAIIVNDNRTFTLCDCKGEGTAYGKITHPVGNTGSGVYVRGTFNMYGGSITNNTANQGGGVYIVNGGAFNLFGGSITNNTADNGGGVYVGGGQFTMYGGEISGNTATVSGGGVSVSGGKFTMSGGRITGNKGSGVFVNDNTTFTVSGAPTVKGNTVNNGVSNVHLTGGTNTTITIGGALTDGASIGVTKGAGSAGSVIATGATEDYSGKFSSDNTQYVVKHDAATKKLVLAVPSAATHTHSYNENTWSKNTTNHWHQCTDADCPNKSKSIKDKAAHVYDNDADATCNVCGYVRTVTPGNIPVSGVALNTTTATLEVGKTTTLTATVTPENAAKKSVTWTSSDTSVATVAADGTVTAVKAGTAAITATAADGSGKSATCTVTVTGGGSTGGSSGGGGSSSGGSSGGGGGSSSPSNHPVKAEVSKDPDGSVSLSKTSAAKGDKVTITVKPERHYEVDEVIVRDSKGKQLAVKDNGDGTFTFEMPADKVTVEPSFSWVNPFADVADSAYYVDAVEWMLKREVTQGTTETTFSPDLNCTRAQIVTFLWRVAGSPAPKGTVSFADVSADSYYAKAVAAATENGITDGIGGGLFSPDATCTRAQSAVFLYRVAGSPAVNGSAGFSDVAADAYYAQAVAWAKEHGITDGIGGGLFGSANDCTRAQIAAFLYRYMK